MEQSVGYRAKAFEGKNLVYFFLIAFGWTWIWWYILFLSGWVTVPEGVGGPEADFSGANAFIIMSVALSPFGPTIGGFILTAINEGKAGAKKLWKSFWSLNINWKWLLVVLLTWPALRLATNLAGQAIAGESYPLLAHPDQVWVFIPVLLVSTLVNGGMSEEFGWRGYALPRLQVKFNALTASVILGIIEGAWHYPLMLMRQRWENSVVELLFWFILTDILRTWIFNNTNGSLLAALLFHGMGNTQSDIIWCCGARSHLFWVFGIATLLIVLIFGPKTLTKKPEQLQEPP
jgi:hypothetical protein